MLAAARAQGTPITQLDGYLRALPESVRWLRRKMEGIAVVHAHEYKTDLLAAVAAGARRSTALVATVRHTEPGLLMGILQALDSLVLHRFDRLTVPSRGALRELRHWPALQRKTQVIHHTFGAKRPKGASIALKRGPVISIVGRLQAVKGHRVFLESARQVLAKRADARFWIVGDGELRADLEAAASSLGLRDAVEFLGYRNDADALMAASDVVVSCSSYEAFARCVTEALALARPVVATAVGGIPEIIRDGETGILVPPGDPQAMATAILRLLDDPGLAARLGSAGRAFVAEHLTIEAQASALASLYREVLACR